MLAETVEALAAQEADNLEIRNAKIVPNWNPLGESNKSLQIMEDDMEMI
jgi:hypothetical protein